MAWDASFSATDAGGWTGDASFATDGMKDQDTVRLCERLPVPTTIKDLLSHYRSSEDKYELGQLAFSTVLTMGIVKSITEDGGTHSYIVQDPDEPDCEYIVNKYNSDGENNYIAASEGDLVKAIGKLKTFDQNNTIMAYKVAPVGNDDYEIFKLEARAATLYFTKNIAGLLKSVETPSLDNTMVGKRPEFAKPGGQQGAGAAAGAHGASTGAPSRLYTPASSQSASSKSHGQTGLKGKIMDVLEGANGEEGSHIDWIADQVGNPSRRQLETMLQEMVNDGHLYNTTGDDYFAIIA